MKIDMKKILCTLFFLIPLVPIFISQFYFVERLFDNSFMAKINTVGGLIYWAVIYGIYHGTIGALIIGWILNAIL